MTDDDLELVYLTLDDALELYAAITDSTTEHATAVLRARSTLEGALARPATYAHYEDADISLQAAVLAHGIAESQAFLNGNKRLALVAGAGLHTPEAMAKGAVRATQGAGVGGLRRLGRLAGDRGLLQVTPSGGGAVPLIFRSVTRDGRWPRTGLPHA